MASPITEKEKRKDICTPAPPHPASSGMKASFPSPRLRPQVLLCYLLLELAALALRVCSGNVTWGKVPPRHRLPHLSSREVDLVNPNPQILSLL